ncbi:hypothetical protein [Helicobacter suis]|uniref:hypothetical protein n=1 Tax=Helicobacter suis TaxID=104628 RepID=UPI0013D4C559|nr:hypothetical protein [Helicobacter suis]
MVKLEDYAQYLGCKMRVICYDDDGGDDIILEGWLKTYAYAFQTGDEDDDIILLGTNGVPYGLYMHEIKEIIPLEPPQEQPYALS